ncbi:CHAP domain-containing protein, partial [Clostridioides difficile]
MKQYKSRDKITQKMTRDGLIEVNETQQTAERISKREQDADFQKSPEQQAPQDGTQLQGVASQTAPLPHAPGAAPARDTATAERVMEHIEAAQTRKSSKKAVRKAQEEATAQTTSSRLQFTEEELAERGAKYGARKLKQGYRSHKLKPYREAAKAEKAAFKANVNFQYHKTLHDNPQLTSNPLSRFMQKQQIKR